MHGLARTTKCRGTLTLSRAACRGVSTSAVRWAIRCVCIVFCVFMTLASSARQCLPQTHVDLLCSLLLHTGHGPQTLDIRTAPR
jgi:hypothetical protein